MKRHEKTERVFLKASKKQKDNWRRAANEIGADLSEWIRGVLDRAAREMSRESSDG